MTVTGWKSYRKRLAVLAMGSTLFLGDCDPTVRSTVEDGIISSSTSLFGSFLQAYIQVLFEPDNTNGN